MIFKNTASSKKYGMTQISLLWGIQENEMMQKKWNNWFATLNFVHNNECHNIHISREKNQLDQNALVALLSQILRRDCCNGVKTKSAPTTIEAPGPPRASLSHCHTVITGLSEERKKNLQREAGEIAEMETGSHLTMQMRIWRTT